MPANKIPFTKEGLAKVQLDLKKLTEKRQEAVIALKTAREMGDLSENAAYKSARFELSSIDRELGRLAYLQKFGVVIKNNHNSTVSFGSRVTLNDGKKKQVFTLVSTFESNPNLQKISYKSPLGQALMGKRVGDKVSVTAPAGKTNYTIIAIE